MPAIVLDTPLFVLTCVFLVGVLALTVWDFWASRTGRTTISVWAKSKYAKYRDRPIIWLTVGLAVGFFFGLVAGVLIGHLFWPQYEVSR